MSPKDYGQAPGALNRVFEENWQGSHSRLMDLVSTHIKLYVYDRQVRSWAQKYKLFDI